MKKIAFIINDLKTGGIEKSCLALLNELVKFYDVTVILCDNKGELLKFLPKKVHILIFKQISFKDVICKNSFLKNLIFTFLHIFSKVSKRWIIYNKNIAKFYGAFNEIEYDCAIAYHGMNITSLVRTLYNIKAKSKVAWIHGNHPFKKIHRYDVNKIYKKFDKIFCCSPSMVNRFKKDFPSLKENLESFKNILPTAYIKKESLGFCDLKQDEFNIVTVGRVSKEKGQELIPLTAKMLVDYGINFKWYIVGDGPDLNRIKDICKLYNLSNNLFFTGNLLNPYPYIKKSDVYVQPSYSEGYCLTVCEAAILEKPIVLTEIASKDILVNNITGIVVKPTSESLFNGILKFYNSHDLRNKITENLKKNDFSNFKEIEKFLNYVGI